VIGWLRRRQPRNPVLAVLFWMVATLVALAVLFFLALSFAALSSLTALVVTGPALADVKISDRAYVIESGHDAWVIGDEPFVGFEFESTSAEEYAKED
jgi:cell division septal protein FtsQ